MCTLMERLGLYSIEELGEDLIMMEGSSEQHIIHTKDSVDVEGFL